MMEAVLPKVDRARIELAYGSVEAREDGRFRVIASGEAVWATRAVACLVGPEPGDVVMVSRDSFGRCYILSVLEREGEGSVALEFDRDVDIRVQNGRLRAAARDGMDLVSTRDVRVVSAGLEVNAQEASMSVPRFSFFGISLDAKVLRTRVEGEVCESLFERVSSRVRRSYRWVAELDQLHAGHLNYLVKKLMSLRGHYTVVTADKDVRIDGDKILMG